MFSYLEDLCFEFAVFTQIGLTENEFNILEVLIIYLLIIQIQHVM